MEDKVNHPKHYNAHPSGIECIQIVRHMNFNLGNAIKYLWRADHKEATIEDLQKAIWYITDEIDRQKALLSSTKSENLVEYLLTPSVPFNSFERLEPFE